MKTLSLLVLIVASGLYISYCSQPRVKSASATVAWGADGKMVVPDFPTGVADTYFMELEGGRIDAGNRINILRSYTKGIPFVIFFHDYVGKSRIAEIREALRLNPGAKLLTCKSNWLPPDLRQHLLLRASNLDTKAKVMSHNPETGRMIVRYWLE